MSTDVEDFDNAFASLTAPQPKNAAVDPVDPPADPAPVDPVDPPADPAPADPVDPPADPAPADPIDTSAELRAELAALKEQLAALERPAPALEPAPAPVPVYDETESAAIKKYQEEWPDIAAGEALIRRAEYQQLVAYVFDQVRKVYDPALEYMGTASTESQYSKIKAQVSDYDEVRDKTLAWIDTQPEYLKNAYTQVANEGSANDVVDLINRFKKETGYNAPINTPSTAPAAAPVAKSAPAALPEAAKKAAASLKVVTSARSEQSASPDPNDFDSAFEEFARSSK